MHLRSPFFENYEAIPCMLYESLLFWSLQRIPHTHECAKNTKSLKEPGVSTFQLVIGPTSIFQHLSLEGENMHNLSRGPFPLSSVPSEILP